MEVTNYNFLSPFQPKLSYQEKGVEKKWQWWLTNQKERKGERTTYYLNNNNNNFFLNEIEKTYFLSLYFGPIFFNWSLSFNNFYFDHYIFKQVIISIPMVAELMKNTI